MQIAPAPMPTTILAHQNEAMALVLGIILLTGLLGGWGAFLADARADEASESKAVRSQSPPSPFRFIVLGTIAALCVPLFLSILKSELIASIFKQPLGPDSYESYLVFSGICLIAAFSSRRFIETMTERVLQQANKAQRDAEQAQAEAINATQVATEVMKELEAADDLGNRPKEDRETPVPATIDDSDAIAFNADDRLKPEERKILVAMQGRTYRTATGISEDSGIARHRISEYLDTLSARKLILATRSPKTGGPRWSISKRGIAALERF